jgi:streptogramin lyase
VAADGSVEDFVASRRDGLWMILGMKVDPSRRHLWVASSEGAYLEGHEDGRGNAAGLFQFDLDDGSLLGRWTLDEGGGTHFFNDLVVTPAGDVYVTHMFNQTAVHVLLASDPRLQVFARPGSFRGANGIALAPDGSLYVASREGLGRFDPATATRTRLALPEGASFTPIDGLYHHSRSLIGIHPEENMVRRFVLDPTGDAITEIEVLEADHPALDGPTTGVIVDGDLYYVANPGIDREIDGELPPLGELEESVILRLPLPC